MCTAVGQAVNSIKVLPICYLIGTVGKVSSGHNMMNYARVEQLVPSMHESKVGRVQGHSEFLLTESGEPGARTRNT